MVVRSPCLGEMRYLSLSSRCTPNTLLIPSQMLSIADLTQVLKNCERRQALQSLRGNSAQMMIDYLSWVSMNVRGPLGYRSHFLQMLIHSEPATRGFQKLVLHTLGNLVGTSMLLPRCYILKHIPALEGVVGMKGFSGVCQGRYGEQNLCLKVMRSSSKLRRQIFEARFFTLRISDPLLTRHQSFGKRAVLWGQLHHPNILPLHGISFLYAAIDRPPCFVSPWMTNGNAIEYLKVNPLISRKSLVSTIPFLCCDVLD